MKYLFPILFLLLSSACGRLYFTGSNMVEVHSEFEKSARFDSLIKPYKDVLAQEMSVVIGQCEMTMTTGFPEGLLGNFVADIVKDSIQKIYPLHNTFALINNGGLRRSLPAGYITKGLIFEIAPFENEIVILQLDSFQMYQLAQYIVSGDEMAISGAEFLFKDTLIGGVSVNGKHLKSSEFYYLITVDYLANGGANMNFLSQVQNRIETGIKLRDLLIDSILRKYIQGQTIKAHLDGRIQIN